MGCEYSLRIVGIAVRVLSCRPGILNVFFVCINMFNLVPVRAGATCFYMLQGGLEVLYDNEFLILKEFLYNLHASQEEKV